MSLPQPVLMIRKKTELTDVTYQACLDRLESPTSSVSFMATVVLHKVNDITDTVAEAKVMKVLVGFPR